jgi:hypothetical protein
MNDVSKASRTSGVKIYPPKVSRMSARVVGGFASHPVGIAWKKGCHKGKIRVGRMTEKAG